MHPYRVSWQPHGSPPQALPDASLAWVALIVWASSVLRAIVGVVRHEPASQELAVAVLVVIAIPWLSRSSQTLPARKDEVR